ncbi:MAG: hypothetical protein MSD70_10885 [Clostridiales bacterium]|nr:hypothetical protein [Clostridiales bacterium]
MGTLTDSLFTVLMSWVRGLVNALWALFSSDHTTALEFLGKHWLLIAAVLIAAGLVIDWIIWLLRWQPYHLWAQRARRLLHIEEPEDEEEEDTPARARAAVMPKKRDAAAEEAEAAQEVPLYLDEQDEQMAMARAQSAPDEYAYPGMRYDSAAQQEMDSTQRYGAVTQEGPGAAEVARRRAEIEAWQLQMQEEARARAEAERAAHEAYEAEQARLAQEAYEAEQARLAQEEYERQMAEYERQRAQYERELAEYERQKAAYDAQMAREAAAQQMQEQAGELAPAQSASRRRRGTRRSYSDYVEGEDVADLPDAPQWPQIPDAQAASPAESAQKKAGSKLLGRMAKMIEPEEEQLAALPKLPPRVDMHDAYRTPAKPGRRNPRI